MPRRCKQGDETGNNGAPCSCEMGNIYRFTEPIVMLAMAKLGQAHGYQISREAEKMAVTHAGLDSGVIYRTLRRLEKAGRVTSAWDTGGGGPARRVYVLTPSGVEHLGEWAEVLKDLTGHLDILTKGCARAAKDFSGKKRPALAKS